MTGKKQVQDLHLHHRWLGYRGEQIKVHRSLRALSFPRSRWLTVLLLPVFFNLLVGAAFGTVTNLWTEFFDFWVTHLGIPGEVTRDFVFDLWGLAISIPSVRLSGSAPTLTVWLIHFAITVALLTVAMWLPARHIPLRYFLGFLIVIHCTALAYFAFFPASFPFDQESYIRNALASMVVFLFVVPWLLAVTFYVFAFSLGKKIGLTLLLIAYFAVFAPTQFMLHAICIHFFSVLMVPLLYFVFGVFLDVMLFMALYGWAMSWSVVE